MAAITGAVLITGLAATLALTGCSTMMEPFEADPVDPSEQDALALANLACAYATAAQRSEQSDEQADKAAAIAAEAAYLDPRWTTLSDALTDWRALRTWETVLPEDAQTLFRRSTYRIDAQCAAAEAQVEKQDK